MTHNVLEEVSDILRSAAAGAVMPRFALLRPGDISMKAVNEPVTIADRDAEEIISRELLSLTPYARVIGEEACASNPTLLENLGDGAVWIVDPIDGTANFAAGRPPFAMMIALLEKGELVASWIFDPFDDRLAVAQRGGGAWINGERLQANPALPVDGKISGIISDAFLPTGKKCLAQRIRAAVETVVPTERCAGHEYPLVATGAQHFALYWRTLVWDHAPGALILTEAGGSATYLDGTPYDPCRCQTGLLLAHNRQIADVLLDVVAPSS